MLKGEKFHPYAIRIRLTLTILSPIYLCGNIAFAPSQLRPQQWAVTLYLKKYLLPNRKLFLCFEKKLVR